MKTIEQSLDYILEQLLQNWDVSRPEDRKPLMCEPTMVTLGFADRFRKHEFFIRLVNRLIKDGYADHIDPHEMNDKSKNPSLIDFYQKNTIITVEGYYAITTKQAYVWQKGVNESDRALKDSRDKRLSDGTVYLAVGTFLLVAWEVYKTFWIERHEYFVDKNAQLSNRILIALLFGINLLLLYKLLFRRKNQAKH